jgi:Ca-activated chloride channel family protein
VSGLLLVLFQAIGPAGAPAADAEAPQFVSGVNFVELYVTVLDPRGEPVTNLVQDDFIVEEDGVRQAIGAFAAGEFPLAVGVGLDHSFSIPAERLNAAAAAARGFVEALRPGDLVMILGIGSEVDVLAPLSDDHGAAAAALGRIRSWGTTPLYDAARSAVEALQPAAGRRALVLISDGDDRYSKTEANELVAEVRRGDVMVYPISTGRAQPAVFAEIAAVSGARSFHAANARDLTSALATIGRELRFQYLLGYAPARPGGERPGWRSIRVAVNRPSARVRAREGYVAP